MADNNNNNNVEEDSSDDETTEITPNPIMNMEEQLNTLVNEIFSTAEFINFFESLQNNFMEQGYDDDDDDASSSNDIDLDVEYNYFIDTISIRPVATTPPVVTTPTPLEFEHFLYEIKDDKRDECSICLVDFETNDIVVSLICNHLFHKSCIVEWSSHKAECPNCREKILNCE
jgi:hypothetical protein